MLINHKPSSQAKKRKTSLSEGKTDTTYDIQQTVMTTEGVLSFSIVFHFLHMNPRQTDTTYDIQQIVGEAVSYLYTT